MVTPKVKKRIGSYVYEVYEEKNLKGIFYNVKVYYDGRYVQTIPYLNFEKPQLLSDVETDVKNKIFTGMDDLIQSKPLPPPPPSTPIEDLPLEPQNKKKPKSEGKIIDNNSNQPIKGAQVKTTEIPPTITPSSSSTLDNNPYKYTISQIPLSNGSFKWGVKIYYNNTFIQTLSVFDNSEFSAEYDSSLNYNAVELDILTTIRDEGFYDKITDVKLPPFESLQIDFTRFDVNENISSPTTSITTSNNKGEVNLILPESSSVNLSTITISAPGYETIEKTPYKGDGTIKEDLGVIQMTPIQTATEVDKIEVSQLKPDQINKLSDSKKTPEYFAQKKLTDLVINLKGTALPLAITLISQFGITKVAQLIDQGKTKSTDLKDKISCPTPTELDKLISRKNKLVKQINNSLKIIDNTTKILGITEGVLLTLDIAYKLLKNLPIPSSVPPGIGLPVNAILGVQDSKDTISKVITKLKTANTGLLTILVIVRQVLIQLLQYLSLLDTLIQQCSPNNELNQEQLSAELTALTQQQSENSPIVTNVNGFEMGVETEATTNSLKRRRAIARNKGGVVMLKGEWSFSSIDQILIDELVFYIQQNDLKAD
jgi:hypothetical protein